MAWHNVTCRQVFFAGSIFLSVQCLASPEIEKLAEQCLGIEHDSERLSCYDDATRQLNLAAVAGEIIGNTGGWKFQSWVSPLDDSNNLIASLDASNTIPSQLGLRDVTPELNVRCKEGEVSAFVTWKRMVDVQNTRQTIRFDQATAYDEIWTISTNHKALMAPQDSLNDFVAKVMYSNKLYVQVTPYGANPAGVVFDLQGSKSAVLKVVQACKML